MWWGHSPPLDLRSEISTDGNIDVAEPLEVLIAGASDARHIVKTLASSYTHPDYNIIYHVIEPTMEQVARSIFFLNVCLDKNLGLQEATRYYLEVLGNTLLRPATAKYLAKCSSLLADIPTQTVDCPWLNLEKFKYKDRDNLEWIFKFWKRATCEGVPIIDYWDRRIRKSLKTRYDYREGVFDWDFHMVLKPRGHSYLTSHEYRFWRNNGVAFTWLEGEPIRSNPTLLSNVQQCGDGFLHYAYLGDITNGPFFTWSLSNENDSNKKLRATDVAEKEVMRTIYEIRMREPLCDELIAAHRDSSILNGIIVTEMPDSEVEQESWAADNKFKIQMETSSWMNIPNAKVVFHPVTSIESLKCKPEYINKFDVIWISHNITKQISNFVPLLKKGSFILVESRKYLSELRKEMLQEFTTNLRNIIQENGLRDINNFNAEIHTVARFQKI